MHAIGIGEASLKSVGQFKERLLIISSLPGSEITLPQQFYSGNSKELKSHVHQKIYARIFIAALFIKAKTQVT